ncbi:hypothetical protein D9611_004333 [Ephemerocybe angulata]|uniref:rRNA-processing protein FYV7 n=1 Tax=Ephemerocybe angulata TaxID=980116 RepID=A0A8H5BJV5_9AGAR|nr:hypothetical protein D9611_004333 [Tulosesus angulatus]
MTEQVQQQRKRKAPPTFQHLAPEQARKLKKQWIEKEKMKSKWRAEKRKLQAEGVMPIVKKPWEIRDEQAADGDNEKNDDSAEPSHSKRARGNDSESDNEGVSDRSDAESDVPPPPKRTKHSSANQKIEALPPHLKKRGSSSSSRPEGSAPRQQRPEKDAGKPKNSWQKAIEESANQPPKRERDFKGKSRAHPQDAANEDGDRPASLRDLKREAFSKTKLHTFKADALHKHSGRGQSFNARGRGGSGPPGRGGRRGQPDMRLRMDYMLEKIKRDYTS